MTDIAEILHLFTEQCHMLMEICSEFLTLFWFSSFLSKPGLDFTFALTYVLHSAVIMPASYSLRMEMVLHSLELRKTVRLLVSLDYVGCNISPFIPRSQVQIKGTCFYFYRSGFPSVFFFFFAQECTVYSYVEPYFDMVLLLKTNGEVCIQGYSVYCCNYCIRLANVVMKLWEFPAISQISFPYKNMVRNIKVVKLRSKWNFAYKVTGIVM